MRGEPRAQEPRTPKQVAKLIVKDVERVQAAQAAGGYVGGRQPPGSAEGGGPCGLSGYEVGEKKRGAPRRNTRYSGYVGGTPGAGKTP